MISALVTGGSGQIGSSISYRLAKFGYHTLIHFHANRARAIHVCDQIRLLGGSADVVQFDVTDARECSEVLEPIAARSPIQVVVSNAGVNVDAPLAGTTEEMRASVINVSLMGFFNVIHPLLLPMIRTRWGRIVSVSSVSGIMGNRGQVTYSAAKAGLHGATRSLAREVATRGITVNCVAPGFIGVGMGEHTFDMDRVRALVPMQRTGTADEVAAVVSFLASSEASYITGQVISVNGGLI